MESRSFLFVLHVLSGASRAEKSINGFTLSVLDRCIPQMPGNGALTGLLSTESLWLALLGDLAGHNGDLKALKSFDPMCIQSKGKYLLLSAAEGLSQPVPKTFPFAQYLLLPSFIHRCWSLTTWVPNDLCSCICFLTVLSVAPCNRSLSIKLHSPSTAATSTYSGAQVG